jgi:hypothetical protein
MATSTLKENVPLLQTIYQSDAAHMNFGKYTLYSCYGITANCNASPVAFDRVFSNEDQSGWIDFWMFAKKIHPRLNTLETTIITNWEKGSIDAIADVLPSAVNFFCSFHQKKNIETFVKGGKGKYLCHWFYYPYLATGATFKKQSEMPIGISRSFGKRKNCLFFCMHMHTVETK